MRRLQPNESVTERIEYLEARCDELSARNAELLAALKAIDCSAQCDWCADIAKAAIARAEEGK